jgi:hypothetical protein
MKTVFTVEAKYNPRLTDPESLAAALDRLLETALSMPGILEEYGNPTFGEFFVAGRTPKGKSAAPLVVLDISGGVLQEVYCNNPRAQVLKIDWDTEGCDPALEGVVEITGPCGRIQSAFVAEFPVLPLADLADTDTAAALQAAGIEWTES